MIKVDIKPNCTRYFNHHLRTWLRLESELFELGIIFVDGVGDIKIVQGSRDRRYMDYILADERPTILHDLYLGPEINWWGLRDFLLLDHVKGIIKTSKFTNASDYDRHWYRERRHIAEIADILEDKPTKHPKISHLYHKIHVFANLVSWDHFQSYYFRNLSFSLHDNRDLQISMILGDIGELYPVAETRTHRRAAVSAVYSLQPKHTVRVRVPPGDPFVESQEYFSVMARSKICVSPWGFDVTCFRDFEAALYGVLLVRPDTAFSTSWPDIPYVVCNVDFSNLEEVVDEILSNYDSYNDMRTQAYYNAQKGRNNKYLAKRFADIIKKCLE